MIFRAIVLPAHLHGLAHASVDGSWSFDGLDRCFFQRPHIVKNGRGPAFPRLVLDVEMLCTL